MNDFSDLENQLKAIRPAPLRETFIARVEQAMTHPASVEPDNVIRPQWFRSRWLAGVSLAAAAAVLVLLRVNFKPPQSGQRTASVSPQPSAMASQSTAHGVAPNGIELHPVLDIIFNPGAQTPDFILSASRTSVSVPEGSSDSTTISTAAVEVWT